MNQQRSSSLSTTAVVVALLVLALPILYVLSVGPAVWLVSSQFASMDVVVAVMWIYAPLEWVSVNVPVVGELLKLYCDLWRR